MKIHAKTRTKILNYLVRMPDMDHNFYTTEQNECFLYINAEENG